MSRAAPPPVAWSDRLMRPLFATYVTVIALLTLLYGWHNVRAANDWAIGEWLINYSAGFVRRGLFGQLVLLLSHATHVPIFVVVLALQMALYGTFFVCVFFLARGLAWTPGLTAILFSPATLAFHVLDPPAGFRKEDILFAGLALLVWLLVKHPPTPWLLTGLLIVFTQFAVLSHEPLALYLPYVFGAVLLVSPSLRAGLRLCGLPALLALLSTGFASRHPGNEQAAATICASVGSHLGPANAGVCGGAILYLSRNLDFARLDVVHAIAAYHYLALYPIDLLLTLAPFVVVVLQLWRHSADRPQQRRRLLLLFAIVWLSAIASVPLFVVATDWGRWIYMHAVCLMLLLLLLLQSFTRGLGPAVTSGRTPPRFRLVVAVVLYATCWTLPGGKIFPGRFGYVDLVRYLSVYNKLPHAMPKN